MSVKVKFHFILIYLSSLLGMLKFIFNDLSIGKFWFYIDGNSLVGLHAYAERLLSSSDKGIFILKSIIFLLELNLLIVLAVLCLLISFVFSMRNFKSLV